MLPQKTFLTKEYAVTPEFFSDGQVQISRLMKCLEDVAKCHAELLGFGFEDMLKQNLLWVISKAKIVFAKPLTADILHIKVTTWPSKNRKFFCNRYFVVTDQRDNDIFYATYVWAMIDKDSRAIASPIRVEQMYQCDFDDALPNMDTTVQKVVLDGNDWLECAHYVAQQKHLDDNNHVNNTHYVQFATLGETQSVIQLEITYQHELLLGESVTVYKKWQGNAVSVVGLKADGTTVSFTARYIIEK